MRIGTAVLRDGLQLILYGFTLEDVCTQDRDMTAFLAPDRPSVDQAHAAALTAGGVSEGAPGLRPQYHANYYGAYFRDLDGNKLGVCCHDPA